VERRGEPRVEADGFGEVLDRLLGLPERREQAAAVAERDRLLRVEVDGRGVVRDGRRRVAVPLVRDAAEVVRVRVLRLQLDGGGEVADGLLEVAGLERLVTGIAQLLGVRRVGPAERECGGVRAARRRAGRE
jgi:hypothetical protein